MTLITRSGIAAKYGIHKGKIISIIDRQPELKFPKPVGRKGNELLYNDDAIAAFFEKNPHDKIVWLSTAHAERTMILQLDKEMMVMFIRGEYDHAEKKRRNEYRRMVARRLPVKTMTVHLRGDVA